MPRQQHTEHSILQSYLLPPSPLPTVLPYSAFLQLVPAQYRSSPHLRSLYRDLQFQRNIDVDIVRQNIEQEVARSFVLKGRLAHRIEAESGNATTSIVKNATVSSKRQLGKRKRSGNIREGNRDDRDDDDDDEDAPDELVNHTDIAIDTTYHLTTLHPSHTNIPPATIAQQRHHPLTSATQRYHSPRSLVAALSTSVATVQSEIADLESESSHLLMEMQEIVGSLSDLRYGRFTGPVNNGSGDNGQKETMEDEVVGILQRLQEKIKEIKS